MRNEVKNVPDRSIVKVPRDPRVKVPRAPRAKVPRAPRVRTPRVPIRLPKTPKAKTVTPRPTPTVIAPKVPKSGVKKVEVAS